MVDIISKSQFAERLHLSLDILGWKQRGRPKQLQDYYSSKGVNLSEKTFHKWLRGQSFPDWDNLIHLARLTSKSISYLIYGIDEAELIQSFSCSDDSGFYSKQELQTAFVDALEQAAVFNLITFNNNSSPEQMFRAFTKALSITESSEPSRNHQL
ncbi:hypothetical protein KIH87_18110 [Paraneptunicella aestuarii]|uniref:hypothetical protein n=1 Tax=Paraneptunicella aestuarii TaxID=2831148 RepID=UPI001E4E320B|nr:hypothetical protein [Paraneptunicella aestuarii]UAA38556.1 hypothetical protein KIH87_18110 [Paraneptunicella aestuarii]